MPAPPVLTKLGDWNPATNQPTLPNSAALSAGQYYECIADGTFLGITFNIGDYIYVQNGSYQKPDPDPLRRSRRGSWPHTASGHGIGIADKERIVRPAGQYQIGFWRGAGKHKEDQRPDQRMTWNT